MTYGINKSGFKRLAQSKQVPERDIKSNILQELDMITAWVNSGNFNKSSQKLKQLINDLSSDTIKITVSSYETGSSVPDYDSEEDVDYETFSTNRNID
jgi:hypothetical protein